MKKAYELANSLLRDRLQKEDKENLEILDELNEVRRLIEQGKRLRRRERKIPKKNLARQQSKQEERKEFYEIYGN